MFEKKKQPWFEKESKHGLSKEGKTYFLYLSSAKKQFLKYLLDSRYRVCYEED